MSTYLEKLDSTDLKILKAVQEDGRISNLQLSALIGLSPAPTLERVKKLEKAKIIESYHACLNKARLQLGITAFIEVNLSRQVKDVIQHFKEKVQDVPEIMECFQITGNADYMIKVVVADMVAFEKLISEKFSQIEEIGSMRTYVVINEVKASKVLPLNYER